MDYIDELLQMSSSNWAFAISFFFLLFFACIGILKGFDYLADRFGFETKRTRQFKQQEEEIKHQQEEIQRLKQEVETYKQNRIHDRQQSFDIQKDLLERLDALRVANVAVLGDRINQKYKYYLQIKGIPEDEFDEFVQLHDAYKSVGGNHGNDEKFEKAMQFRILTVKEMLENGIY